jgi:hypothetical protein
MTAILSCPFLGWDFTIRTNEDWTDSSYQYLDSTNAPIPWDGMILKFLMRKTALNPLNYVSASTTGVIDGLATSGQITTTDGVWGITVPRAVMLQIPAGDYVWEMQAVAEVTRTIGQGAVHVVQGFDP